MVAAAAVAAAATVVVAAAAAVATAVVAAAAVAAATAVAAAVAIAAATAVATAGSPTPKAPRALARVRAPSERAPLGAGFFPPSGALTIAVNSKGKPRGFAFLELASEEEAQAAIAAIAALAGTELHELGLTRFPPFEGAGWARGACLVARWNTPVAIGSLSTG